MGPVVWWWRWWLGLDPNRELAEARGLLDEQRAETSELSVELNARDSELASLRGRIDSLEVAQDEAERLRAELEHARADAEQTRTRLTDELQQARADAEQTRTRLTDELEQARADAEQLRARIAELEAGGAAATDATEATDGTTPSAPPDVEAAREVIGARVRVDDLTLVEGVGPKIAALLADAGIDSWRALADADVARLRQVLDDAGPRYRMHDPSSWPTQGRLLADGRWQDFKDLSTR